MKVVYSFLFAFLFLSVTVWAQPEAELVKKVKAKMDRVKDYQASGKMKIDVSFINAPESNVTIYYKKPDKFKVNKEGGISILPKGGVSVNISSLLNDNNYTVVPAGTATVRGVMTKVVKMLPLSENSDVVLTTLYIDEKDLVVRKATVTTRESGSYEMELDYKKFIQWGLPDKVVFLFNTKDYKLPKGLTFEYEKGGSQKPQKSKDANNKGRVEIQYANYTINKGIEDKVFK
jgi:outer membrane lipoprotein-sorting protein